MDRPRVTVTVAPLAGFCFGVRRADEMVRRLVDEDSAPVYTYGELIHNSDYIRALADKGISSIERVDDVDAEKREQSICVIRTHGVAAETEKEICASFGRVVDATCPFVKKIHKIVAENSAPDVDTIIIGREGHPEVVGIRSYVRGDVNVFEDPEQIKCY